VRRRIDAGSVARSCSKKQFLRKTRRGKLNEAAWRADKKLLEREHRALHGAVGRVLPHGSGCKISAPALRRGRSRYLSCRADTASPPADGALISVSAFAGTGQERTCPEAFWKRRIAAIPDAAAARQSEAFANVIPPMASTGMENRAGKLRPTGQAPVARRMPLSMGVAKMGQRKGSPRHRLRPICSLQRVTETPSENPGLGIGRSKAASPPAEEDCPLPDAHRRRARRGLRPGDRSLGDACWSSVLAVDFAARCKASRVSNPQLFPERSFSRI